MFDALVDTLMALWNATWRETVVSGFVAFLIGGVCLFLFFVQLGLPIFPEPSSASSPASLQRQPTRSGSLAINVHRTSSVLATAVPVSAKSHDTKALSVPTPTSATTEAPGDTASVPTPIPALPPALLPVDMPGIVPAPGLDGSTNIGTTNPFPMRTSSSMKKAHPPTRHHPPSAPIAPVPPPVVTARATSPAATLPTAAVPETPVPSVPTSVAAPVSPPPTLVEVTPTVVIPASAPTPTSYVPIYPVARVLTSLYPGA